MIRLGKENAVYRRATELLDAKGRLGQGRFLAEGMRLVRDALKCGAAADEIFVTPESVPEYGDIAEEAARRGVPVYEISGPMMRRLADTVATQAVVCAVRISRDGDFKSPAGFYCGLEDLRDPGNVGTILRTAEAFGFSGAVISAGCADPYSPKAVRASMGAVFRLPIIRGVSFPEFLRSWNGAAYASVPGGQAEDVRYADFVPPLIMIIGGEADGIRPETAALCRRVTVPMAGGAESLNAAAAAAVLMWEVCRDKE